MQVAETVRNGDVELAVYRWGSETAEHTILMVHGYPDSARIWQQTAELLAERYQVIAYDVRGAGASTRCSEVADYTLDKLVADMAAVLDAVSPKKSVHLLGHDWGAIQSWEAVTTARLRGRIVSYTSISGPSLDHAGHWLRRRLSSGSIADKGMLLKQLSHSWYIGLFHLPVIAPSLWRLVGNRGWPTMLQAVEGIAHAETCEHQSADGLYGVNLYRANVLPRITRPAERYANIPVHLIFPLQDHFMVEEIWQDIRQWVGQLWRTDVEAGHWLPMTHAQLLADKMHEFVSHLEGAEASRALQHAKARAQQMKQAQPELQGETRWLHRFLPGQ